jgi:hypothetical protein
MFLQLLLPRHPWPVPFLLLPDDLEPVDDELSQSVSVILETGVRKRYSRLAGLLIVPERQLLNKLLPSYQRLSVTTAKALMYRRNMGLVKTSRSMEKTMIVIRYSVTAAHRLPVIRTRRSTDALN